MNTNINILPEVPMPSLKFYRLSVHEKIFENGELVYRDELVRVFHSTVIKVAGGFTVHIEVFDRIHRNRNLSVSEKEFLSQVASATDELKLNINSRGEITGIINLKQVREKAEQKIAKLSKSYLGYHAETGFRFLKNFFKNEKLIVNDLVKNAQYGLLLGKYYGTYNIEQAKVFNTAVLNVLGHTAITIEEAVRAQPIDSNKMQINISGRITEINNDACINEMVAGNLAFDAGKDSPKLDKYEGVFYYEKYSGVVSEASISMNFSFGKNYLKTIDYTLNEISHEEV